MSIEKSLKPSYEGYKEYYHCSIISNEAVARSYTPFSFVQTRFFYKDNKSQDEKRFHDMKL